jgi:hypothetical protein
MGVSTDAILAFGFDLGEELPEALLEVLAEDSYFTFEDFVLKLAGLVAPDYDKIGLPEWDDYRSAKSKAITEFPVEIVRHCSGSCPMYFLSVNGTQQSARRGYPQDVKLVDISEEQLARLKEFCERFGIEWQEPSWQLFSYWDQ